MSSVRYRIEVYYDSYGCPEYNLMGYVDINKLLADCEYADKFYVKYSIVLNSSRGAVLEALNKLPKRFYKTSSIIIPYTQTQLNMALFQLKQRGHIESKHVYRTEKYSNGTSARVSRQLYRLVSHL